MPERARSGEHLEVRAEQLGSVMLARADGDARDLRVERADALGQGAPCGRLDARLDGRRDEHARVRLAQIEGRHGAERGEALPQTRRHGEHARALDPALWDVHDSVRPAREEPQPPPVGDELGADAKSRDRLGAHGLAHGRGTEAKIGTERSRQHLALADELRRVVEVDERAT